MRNVILRTVILLMYVLCDSAAVLAQSAPVNLDLSSTQRSMSAATQISGNSTATIQLDGASRVIDQSSSLTPAEHVALTQILQTGSQSIMLSALGQATAGNFYLTAALSQQLSNLVIPSGVTAFRDFGNAGQLNVAGNITNAGVMQAFSTVSSVNTATIAATNIFNLTSGIITSLAHPQLPANALAKLNLSLIAQENVINNGQILSSGDLSIVAGGSIVNQAVSATDPAPVISASDNIALNVGSNLTNDGIIRSATGNLNVVGGPHLTINATGGLFEALDGDITLGNPSAETASNLTIRGGDYLSSRLNLNARFGTVDAQVGNVTGEVNIHCKEAFLHANSNYLHMGTVDYTDDPIITYITDQNSPFQTLHIVLVDLNLGAGPGQCCQMPFHDRFVVVEGPITMRGGVLALTADEELIVNAPITSTAASGTPPFNGDILMTAGEKITVNSTVSTVGATIGLYAPEVDTTGGILQSESGYFTDGVLINGVPRQLYKPGNVEVRGYDIQHLTFGRANITLGAVSATSLTLWPLENNLAAASVLANQITVNLNTDASWSLGSLNVQNLQSGSGLVSVNNQLAGELVIENLDANKVAVNAFLLGAITINGPVNLESLQISSEDKISASGTIKSPNVWMMAPLIDGELTLDAVGDGSVTSNVVITTDQVSGPVNINADGYSEPEIAHNGGSVLFSSRGGDAIVFSDSVFITANGSGDGGAGGFVDIESNFVQFAGPTLRIHADGIGGPGEECIGDGCGAGGSVVLGWGDVSILSQSISISANGGSGGLGGALTLNSPGSTLPLVIEPQILVQIPVLSATGGAGGGLIIVEAGSTLQMNLNGIALQCTGTGNGGQLIADAGLSGSGDLLATGAVSADGAGFGDGGGVYLSSAGDLRVDGSINVRGGTIAGNGGNIELFSGGSVSLASGTLDASARGSDCNGGSIIITSGEFDPSQGRMTIASDVSAKGFGNGDGGTATLTYTSEEALAVSGVVCVDAPGAGHSGDIDIKNPSAHPLTIALTGMLSADSDTGIAATITVHKSVFIHPEVSFVVIDGNGVMRGPVDVLARDVQIHLVNQTEPLKVKSIEAVANSVEVIVSSAGEGIWLENRGQIKSPVFVSLETPKLKLPETSVVNSGGGLAVVSKAQLAISGPGVIAAKHDASLLADQIISVTGTKISVESEEARGTLHITAGKEAERRPISLTNATIVMATVESTLELLGTRISLSSGTQLSVNSLNGNPAILKMTAIEPVFNSLTVLTSNLVAGDLQLNSNGTIHIDTSILTAPKTTIGALDIRLTDANVTASENMKLAAQSVVIAGGTFNIGFAEIGASSSITTENNVTMSAAKVKMDADGFMTLSGLHANVQTSFSADSTTTFTLDGNSNVSAGTVTIEAQRETIRAAIIQGASSCSIKSLSGDLNVLEDSLVGSTASIVLTSPQTIKIDDSRVSCPTNAANSLIKLEANEIDLDEGRISGATGAEVASVYLHATQTVNIHDSSQITAAKSLHIQAVDATITKSTIQTSSGCIATISNNFNITDESQIKSASIISTGSQSITIENSTLDVNDQELNVDLKANQLISVTSNSAITATSIKLEANRINLNNGKLIGVRGGANADPEEVSLVGREQVFVDAASSITESANTKLSVTVQTPRMTLDGEIRTYGSKVTIKSNSGIRVTGSGELNAMPVTAPVGAPEGAVNFICTDDLFVRLSAIKGPINAQAADVYLHSESEVDIREITAMARNIRLESPNFNSHGDAKLLATGTLTIDAGGSGTLLSKELFISAAPGRAEGLRNYATEEDENLWQQYMRIHEGVFPYVDGMTFDVQDPKNSFIEVLPGGAPVNLGRAKLQAGNGSWHSFPNLNLTSNAQPFIDAIAAGAALGDLSYVEGVPIGDLTIAAANLGSSLDSIDIPAGVTVRVIGVSTLNVTQEARIYGGLTLPPNTQMQIGTTVQDPLLIGHFGVLTGGGLLSLVVAGSVDVAGTIQGSKVELTSNGAAIAISGELRGTNSVMVAATMGDVTKSGNGLIETPSAVLTAGGSIGSTNNPIRMNASSLSIVGFPQNAFISNDNGLSVQGANVSGNLQLSAAGSLSIGSSMSANELALATTLPGGSIAINADVTALTKLTISTSGSGSINTSVGTLRGPEIALSSASGNIGGTHPVSMSTSQLSVMTNGQVWIANVGDLIMGGSSSGSSFKLESVGNVLQLANTNISSPTLEIAVIGGDIGSASNALRTSANSLTVNTDGSAYVTNDRSLELAASAAAELNINVSGSVTQMDGSNIAANACTIFATQALGAASNPLQTQVAFFTGSSGIGGIFVSNTGGIELGDIDSSNGSIVLTASSGLLSVRNNATISSAGGSITLQNAQNGQIVLGTNVVVQTDASSGQSGWVYIVVGELPSSVVFGTPPSYVSLSSTHGGKAHYGTNGITTNSPMSTIELDGAHIVFSTGTATADAIQLLGNDQFNLSGPPTAISVSSLDLMDPTSVSLLRSLQNSGDLGGSLQVSGGIATGGTLVIRPENLDTLSALNIPSNVTVTFNDFTAADAINVVLSSASTTKQVLLSGTGQFLGTNQGYATLHVTSDQPGPVVALATTGSLTSTGDASITANGNISIGGQITSAVRIEVVTTNGGDILLGQNLTSDVVSLTAAGNIIRSTSSGKVTAAQASFSAVGSVGSATMPMWTAGTSISVTAGTSAYFSPTGSVTLATSTVGGNFVVNNSTTAGNIGTNGPISGNFVNLVSGGDISFASNVYSTIAPVYQTGGVGKFSIAQGFSASSPAGMTLTMKGSNGLGLSGNINVGTSKLTLDYNNHNIILGNDGGSSSADSSYQFGPYTAAHVLAGTIEFKGVPTASVSANMDLANGPTTVLSFPTLTSYVGSTSKSVNLGSSSLRVTATGTINSGHITGGPYASQSLQVSLSTNGSIVVDGDINVSGSGQIVLIGSAINVSGTINGTGGQVVLQAASINNTIALGDSADGNGNDANFDLNAAELSRITAGQVSIRQPVITGAGSVQILGNLNIPSSGWGSFDVDFRLGGNYNATGRTITLGGAHRLSLSTLGTVNTGSVTAGSGGASALPISFASKGTLTVDGDLSAQAAGTSSILLTTSISGAANGSILLGGNVGGAVFTTITAHGTGTITQSSGTVSGTNLALSSGSGSIGPVSISSTTVTATTGGSGSVSLSTAGSITIGTSASGGNFSLTAGGSITTNSISSNGGISLISGSGTLTVNASKQLLAQGGDIVLQNTDQANGNIIIGQNAVVKTWVNPNLGTGDVWIVVGPKPSTPIAGTTPSNTTVNLTNGGTVYFGSNGIVSSGSQNTIDAIGKRVIFSTGTRAASAIQLSGGTRITADPSGEEQVYEAIPIEFMYLGGCAPTTAPTNGITIPEDPADLWTRTLLPIINLPSTDSLPESSSGGQQVDQDNLIPVAFTTSQNFETTLEAVTLRSSGKCRLARTAEDGICLVEGELMLDVYRKFRVEAGKASVELAPGSLILISKSVSSTRIVVLAEHHNDAVVITTNARRFNLRAGQEARLILAPQSSPAGNDNTARRKTVSMDLNGTKLLLNEISLVSLMQTNNLLRKLWKSDAKQDLSITKRIHKTAACLMQVTANHGIYIPPSKSVQ